MALRHPQVPDGDLGTVVRAVTTADRITRLLDPSRSQTHPRVLPLVVSLDVSPHSLLKIVLMYQHRLLVLVGLPAEEGAAVHRIRPETLRP